MVGSKRRPPALAVGSGELLARTFQRDAAAVGSTEVADSEHGVRVGTAYRHPIGYDEALAMTIGEMRQYLGIPATGQADHPAKLHPDAPAGERYALVQ